MSLAEYRLSPSLPRPKRSKGPSDAPVTVWELVALSALLGVYILTMVVVGDQGTFLVNLIGPAIFGLVLLAGVIPPVLRDPNLVWTPLFWFRVATAVYFSFGNVISFFLGQASQMELIGFFAQYADYVTKLNAVTTLCMIIVLATARLIYTLFHNKKAEVRSEKWSKTIKSPNVLIRAGLAFLAVGLFVKFVFVAPTELGVSENLLPGSVGSLSLLADAGIYLLAVWAWNFRPSMLFVPISLVVLEAAFGLLDFNKTDVVAPVLVLLMAWLSKGFSLPRIAFCVGVISLIFAVMFPFVNAGRAEMVEHYGSIEGAGIPERTEIASHYFEGTKTTGSKEEESLVRFVYVSCATFALSLYDNGHPGDTLSTLPAMFVPRALWPAKPNMVEIGREFSYMANGNANSLTAPGWFAESYWDFGWFGPWIFMIPLGIVLQLWSAASFYIVRNGKWLYFPVCLLGVKVAQSPDGFIVLNVVDPIIFALVAFGLIRAGEEIYRRINPDIAPIETLAA